MTAEIHPVPDGYAAAVAELEAILREIEDDDVDVDVLADRVSRAAALIEFCRSRILAARTAVDQAAQSLDDGSGSP
jgi:exodeoxyribonuclease VII small subunit